MRYAHWVFYALVLLAVYGFCRPQSRAGRAVISVTDAFADVLGSKAGDTA